MVNKEYFLTQKLKQPLYVDFRVKNENIKLNIQGYLFEISNKKFSISFNRKHLPCEFRSFLSFDFLINQNASLYLPDIFFSLSGVILSVDKIRSKGFDICLKFEDEAPNYWRECILDMLKNYPNGEFSGLHFSA